MISFKGAFQCSNCPRSNNPDDARSCPAWWEMIEKNDVTSAERVTKDCAFLLMPRLFAETMRFSQRAAACAITAREDLLKEFDRDRARYSTTPILDLVDLTRAGGEPRRALFGPSPMGPGPHDVEPAGLVGPEQRSGDELSYPGPADNRGIGHASE